MGYEYTEENAAAYDLAVPFDETEFAFLLEEARRAEPMGLRTLELACGTGRVAVPLVREGVRLLGVDNSTPMLSRAREKSAGLPNAEWTVADITRLALGEQFGLIILVAGTFQLLLDVEQQVACLRGVREHLAPDGRFVFDVAHGDPVAMASWLTERRGQYVRNRQRDYVNPQTGNRVQAWSTIEYRTSQQRSINSGFSEEIDEQGVVMRTQYGRPMELRYFGRYEVEHLLARCGLAVDAMYGDYARSPFRGTSPQMVWVTRRAD